MTSEEAASIAQRVLPIMQQRFWIAQFNIEFEATYLPDGTLARVNVDFPYNRMLLQLDPRKVDSEEEVIDALLHEVAHIATAEFNWLRDDIVLPLHPENQDGHIAIHNAFHMANERIAERLTAVFQHAYPYPDAWSEQEQQ